MNISEKHHPSPQFQAKIHLKDTRALLSPSLTGTTKIDAMFNENRLVKGLEKTSIALKKNIIKKYFQDQGNFITRVCAKTLEKAVRYSRILADRITFLSNRSTINKLNKTFVETNPKSEEYIEELAKVGNSLNKKFIITNLEDSPLTNLSKSKNATIFVMNHPNYHKDKFTYLIINSLLNKMYVSQGRQANCPRPKIIVSKNMLTIVGEKVGKIYKQLGLTEVDASLKNRDVKSNAAPMRNLLKEFIQNKTNIFIFPEGNNSTFKDKTIEEKIQPGIAEFIKSAAKAKESVRVVPIGIDYAKDKHNLGKIFIGKPIYIKQSQKDIVYTQGTDKKRIVRTNHKKCVPVILKEITDNIKYGMEKASELH